MRRILLACVLAMTTCIAQETATTSSAPDLAELKKMSARFAPPPLQVDTSKLSPGYQKALNKVIQAARIINRIFMDRCWSCAPTQNQNLARAETHLRRHLSN